MRSETDRKAEYSCISEICGIFEDLFELKVPFVLISHDGVLYSSTGFDNITEDDKSILNVVSEVPSREFVGNFGSNEIKLFSEKVISQSFTDCIYFVLIKEYKDTIYEGFNNTWESAKIYHDIQEPLRNISNFFQLIEKESSVYENANLKNYVSCALVEVTNFRNLINNLVPNASSKKKYAKRIDLLEMIEKIKEVLAPQIKQRKCVISISENFPRIIGRYNDIFSLFKNLVENSLKHAKSNNLKIEIYGISSEDKNDEINIIFKDNGRISACERSKIKNILSEIDEPSLGLLICKSAAKDNMGNLRLIEEENFLAYEIILKKA